MEAVTFPDEERQVTAPAPKVTRGNDAKNVPRLHAAKLNAHRSPTMLGTEPGFRSGLMRCRSGRVVKTEARGHVAPHLVAVAQAVTVGTRA